MSYRAVIFDLGGVVLDSPLDAFARYEEEQGLPSHTLGRAIALAGAAGAWARLERGELTMGQFCVAFDDELRAQGVRASAAALMEKIAQGTQVRPVMVEAIRRIRRAGLRAAALTNNWASEDQGQKMDELRAEFDVFVESVRAGVRKPEARIYELTCEQLAVRFKEVVFLDDLGSNLKPARAMGMTTLKVSDPLEALERLSELLGFPLRA